MPLALWGALRVKCNLLGVVLDSPYLIPIHTALVGEVVKHVGGLDRLWSALLVAENEVDPVVQLTGNKLRLQCLKGKVKRRVTTPRGVQSQERQTASRRKERRIQK